MKGHILIIYIDDLLLVGQSYEKCVNTIIETLILLEKRGFVIHPVKSVFIPVQEITFLGFLNQFSYNDNVLLTRKKTNLFVSLQPC